METILESCISYVTYNSWNRTERTENIYDTCIIFAMKSQDGWEQESSPPHSDLPNSTIWLSFASQVIKQSSHSCPYT